MTLKHSVLLAMAAGLFFSIGCGRSASRYLGKDHRQVLDVKNMERFINVSFDKRDNSTVKDVTFLATDGYVYTREFIDASTHEGVIRWVPSNEEESLIQSRALSRWTGGAVNAKLPEDCKEVLCVDVGYASKSKRVKNLCYRSTDGAIYTREYKDAYIGRDFVGWMEITGEPVAIPAVESEE